MVQQHLAQRLMRCCFAISRHPALLRRASVSVGVVCLSLFAAIGSRAQDGSQDVAEAARQQRARKAARAEAAQAETHVYTNDDLQRSHILVDEDSARVAARKQNSAATQAAISHASAPVSETPRGLQDGDGPNVAEESLGAVARRYRQGKTAREAMRASGDPMAWHFKLEIPASSLAEFAPRSAAGVAPNGAPHVGSSVAARAANNATPHIANNVANGVVPRVMG